MPQRRHCGFLSLTQCQQTLLSLGTEGGPSRLSLLSPCTDRSHSVVDPSSALQAPEGWATTASCPLRPVPARLKSFPTVTQHSCHPLPEPPTTAPGRARQGLAAAAHGLRLLRSSFLCFTVCAAAFPAVNHWGNALPWEGTATPFCQQKIRAGCSRD